MAPLNLSPPAPSHLGFFLPSALARGCADASTVAARVSARQCVPPSQEFVAAEPTMRGRGGGEDEVTVALGEEEDGAAHRPRLRRRPPSNGGPRRGPAS